MSRSGYCDDSGGWDLIRWRGAVNSAIRGKRGQQFLRELLEQMDAMESKRLVEGALEADGEFCTLGVVAAGRGLKANDPEDAEEAANLLGIANALAREIVYENDECGMYRRNPTTGSYEQETPEQRWVRMRAWVAKQIAEQARPDQGGE
ncbi:hypothetical protein SAMN05216421_1076 [Halopseudomonas xinjiangensis]|uniref:Uncharacterized protein n=1 Tax=Halopseudomonas xinjiangensis TaxID=487184 RepID=A0A1H1Q7E0_9GAMM|nr:hypothetical protein [Halopseudomonas xinjiangensis]SDS19438.1 hypothetical protein SAMN05216421_1076 [Halopseudomonas xinjiangensis]